MALMTEKDTSMHEANTTQVEIKRAVPEDAEGLCSIRDKGWLAAYPNPELGITVEDVRLMAQGPNGEYVPRRIAGMKERFAKQDGINTATFVARIGNKIAGYADPFIDEQGHHRVGALYVDPDLHGRGIGSKLMQKVLEFYGPNKDIYLEVVSYNQNAINFYKRFGFEATDGVVPEEEGRPDYLKSLPLIEMVRRATSA